MDFLGLNWSSLIVYLALAIIGIWVSYSFLNKRGLYLFSVLAVAVCFGAYPASVFSRPVAIATVIMPVVYLALFTCFYKHGKEETKKLFMATLIAMITLFVCKFFEAAYLDTVYKAQIYLSWNYLGSFVASIVAFSAASALTLFITSKINVKSLQNFLKLAVYLLIASAINSIVYTVLVYTGIMSFGNILLTMLICLVILALVCLVLGYFEKFFNRKLAPEKHEEAKQEKEIKEEDNTVVEEQPKEEVKTETTEEISTPDDID